MDTMLDIVRQEEIEHRYVRKHIDAKIKEALLSNESNAKKVHKAVELLDTYLSKTDYFESKQARVNQIKHLNRLELVLKVFTTIAYIQKPTLFTAVTSMMAAKLNMADTRDAIYTIAEIVGVLCYSDAYDVFKLDRMASLYVQSNIELNDEILHSIEFSQYVPPMVCEPLKVHTNYDSGYLTYKESLILGSGNHHNGNICLDVINKMNSVPLKLNIDFLKAVEEKPNKDYTVEAIIEDRRREAFKASLSPNARSIPEIPTEKQAKLILQEMLDDFEKFKKQSRDIYLLLGAKMDNKMYVTWKVDKRGRLYSQGYHINPQGASYKKASVELFHEEIVEM